jgi:hypothetical protein
MSDSTWVYLGDSKHVYVRFSKSDPDGELYISTFCLGDFSLDINDNPYYIYLGEL